MTVGEWLEWAKADAVNREMPDLIAALEGLAQATERLRAADWNDDADKATPFDFAYPSTPLGVTLSLSKGQGEPQDFEDAEAK